MKKTLVAGAAALAFAAMPAVGVFADDPASVTHGGTLTDRIQFTIAHTCTMIRKTGATHTNGYNNTGWTENSPTGTDTMALGNLTLGAKYSLGSSKFIISCNGTDGYSVSAAITNLTSGSNVISAGGSAIASTPATSSWTIYNGTDYISANGVVKSKDSPTTVAGDELTMTYELGLADGQASGSYAGQVVYTLTDANPPSNNG